jgi:eukaryotic-like serine/threonine-protein kinase
MAISMPLRQRLHPDSPQVGTTLGQYELIRRLGAGGAGEVYLARHAILEQQYAVKILHPTHAGSEEFMQRFFQEARLASRLMHQNIVRVITADRHGEIYYLVMEFIEGHSLDTHVARSPLAPERAARYVEQVLDGLQYAHEQGMLHRDVKGENVLIRSEDDIPKIVDFGLVKEVEQSNRLTARNAVVGTPYYMSPEQWRSQEVDARTDVFSTGVLLYFLLTGRYPFPGDSPLQVAHRLVSGVHDPLGPLELPRMSPSSAAALGAEMTSIIDRALARERDERFPSARAFADALTRWRQTLAAVPALPPPSPTLTYTPPVSVRPETGDIVISSSSTGHLPLSHKEPAMKPLKRAVNLVTEPVEIAENTFWVGKRPEDEIFYANPYLRHFPGRPGVSNDFNLIIDPGSSKDFAVVQAKVSQVIGSANKISSVFINHQDPDVGSSVGLLLGRYTPEAYVLCTEDTWRLVHYYNIPRNRFVALEKFPGGIKLPTGDVVLPVPSPFCHFVGAMMLYDPSTRVLFSGDLFGGLTDKGAQGLYADESDWTGMRAFHQIYMPTQRAIKNAIKNIRRLDPPVEIIAPQHGRVITGPYVREYMDLLENLPVGLDILEDRHASDDELRAWSTVLERVLDVARAVIGDKAIAYLEQDPNLRGNITFTGGTVAITSLGKTSVERVVRLLCGHVPYSTGNALKYEAVYASTELGLPTPSVELDEDGPADSMVASNKGLPSGFQLVSAD